MVRATTAKSTTPVTPEVDVTSAFDVPEVKTSMTHKILGKVSYPEFKTATVAGFKLQFNEIIKLQKENGEVFYELTQFFKPRNGARLFVHHYTDMKSGFKSQACLVTGKEIKKIVGLKNIGLIVKSYLA